MREPDTLVPGMLAPLSVGATTLGDDASTAHALGGTEGRKE